LRSRDTRRRIKRRRRRRKRKRRRRKTKRRSCLYSKCVPWGIESNKTAHKIRITVILRILT
jgi:hypothetical protein